MRYLLFLLFIFNTANAVEQRCGTFPGGIPGGYCIHTPTENHSDDLVYYFHGMGGSQNDWIDPWYYTQQIRQEWKAKGVKVPTVIAISFGPQWFLAEKNNSPYSGLFELFTKDVMPILEANVGPFKRRMVMGESMGGLNTTQLALKTNLFVKAAIICAPMSEVSPFASPAVIRAHVEKSSAYAYYRQTNPADPDFVFNTAMEAAQIAQKIFPTQTDFDTADPLNLAKSSSTSTSLYVVAGFTDRYALYEGNQKFVQLLNTNGKSVEWHPSWGGHCVVDVASLAKFLVD